MSSIKNKLSLTDLPDDIIRMLLDISENPTPLALCGNKRIYETCKEHGFVKKLHCDFFTDMNDFLDHQRLHCGTIEEITIEDIYDPHHWIISNPKKITFKNALPTGHNPVYDFGNKPTDIEELIIENTGHSGDEVVVNVIAWQLPKLSTLETKGVKVNRMTHER